MIVASAVRTPLGAFCGQLEGLSEQQLAAFAMREALLARAVHALRRRSARTAMVALGAEGGQGMAMVLRNPG